VVGFCDDVNELYVDQSREHDVCLNIHKPLNEDPPPPRAPFHTERGPSERIDIFMKTYHYFEAGVWLRTARPRNRRSISGGADIIVFFTAVGPTQPPGLHDLGSSWQGV